MSSVRTPAILLLALLLSACAGSAGTSVGVGPTGPSQSQSPTPAPSASEGPVEDPHERALAQLERAREDWAAEGPDSYAYELRRVCFCPPEATGPWTVDVVDGEVARVVDADGRPVDPAAGFVGRWTVEDVHDQIGAMLASDPASTTPSGGYDAMGLPVELHVDPSPQTVDEEATWTVRLVDQVPAPGGAAGGAAGGSAVLEPLSEGALLATGQPLDPAGAFTATPVCGPTDAVLGYEVVGTFPTDEPLDDAVARLTAAGLEATRGEDDVVARGTTAAGAPITIHLMDGEALVTLDLESLPQGGDVTVDGVCG